jgi:hypothetical protein
MDAPTGPDQLSTAFTTALTSPGGVAVQALQAVTARHILLQFNHLTNIF